MILKIKVKPNAKENKLEKVEHPDYDYKVNIKAQPEKGKANKELINFLASEFGVARQAVILLTGETSLIKRIQIGL